MGERDRGRVRVDLRAIRRAVSRGLVFTLATWGLLLGVRYACDPVVRELSRGLSLPSWWQLGVGSSVVGAAGFFTALRSTGRLSADGLDGTDAGRPGARALAIARAQLAVERGPGVPVTGSVQRWSSDLLTGGPADEVPALTTEMVGCGPEAGPTAQSGHPS